MIDKKKIIDYLEGKMLAGEQDFAVDMWSGIMRGDFDG